MHINHHIVINTQHTFIINASAGTQWKQLCGDATRKRCIFYNFQREIYI